MPWRKNWSWFNARMMPGAKKGSAISCKESIGGDSRATQANGRATAVTVGRGNWEELDAQGIAAAACRDAIGSRGGQCGDHTRRSGIPDARAKRMCPAMSSGMKAMNLRDIT